MKILFPILNFNNSGGLRIALQYCRGLSDLGHDVTLIYPCSNLDEVIPSISGVNIRRLITPKIFRNYLYYLGVIFSFHGKIEKDALIIATSWQSLFITVLNKISFNNIILIIQHDDDIILGNSNSIGNIFKKGLFRIAYFLPIKKISVSNWLSFHLSQKYNIEVDSISNGVISKNFYGLLPDVWTPPKDTVDILCFARSVDWKGFDDFLKAAHILSNTINNLRLVIVSQEEFIFDTKVPFVIHRPSNDKELGLIFRTSTLFVFSSWIEGFGLPPLEAMANGLPVVTTQCGGISDFAINGYNCLTVDIQSPNKIAEAVLKMLKDESLMKLFSKNGILTANNFKMENAILKLNSIIMNN